MEYRNRGFGTRLLEQSLTKLREAGLKEAVGIAHENAPVTKFLYTKFNSTPSPLRSYAGGYRRNLSHGFPCLNVRVRRIEHRLHDFPPSCPSMSTDRFRASFAVPGSVIRLDSQACLPTSSHVEASSYSVATQSSARRRARHSAAVGVRRSRALR